MADRVTGQLTHAATDPMQGYGVVLVDPPWTYTSEGRPTEAPGAGWHGDASKHYPTMKLADIKALPVGEWAQADSMLWLWAVNSMLPQAIDVMSAWGFTYKTCLTWGKTTKAGMPAFGMGYWLRGATEHVLIGTRGKIKPGIRDARSLFLSERLEHSRKPDQVHELIERYHPGPYLEVFARRSRQGWSSWGNEL